MRIDIENWPELKAAIEGAAQVVRSFGAFRDVAHTDETFFHDAARRESFAHVSQEVRQLSWALQALRDATPPAGTVVQKGRSQH